MSAKRDLFRRRLIILGSGPAGYTAAIYAARANLQPLLVAGHSLGGQLTTTTEVDNWPADPEGVMGPALMERFLRHAQRFDVEIVRDHIESVDLGTAPFTLHGRAADYACEALVIATGATAKYLGLSSETAFLGRGVSACATCDGFFYRGREVVVVGGGNTAVEEALYLSNLARKVTVIHRRDEFRAERILQERLFRKDNIKVLWDHVVEEITGEARNGPMPPSVTGLKLRNMRTGEVSEMATDGVFVAIGHAPAVDLFAGKLKQKPNGYLWTAADSTATDVPGVFAAGDVTDDVYRQAVTAAGMGCMAALEAERYIAELDVAREAAQ